MSKGRVVAIYHNETRKVLGYIPIDVILRQTEGYRSKYRVPIRLSPYDYSGSECVFEIVHDGKGNPIKVIAESQREADTLIRTEGLTSEERTAAMLNEPNPILEGLKL